MGLEGKLVILREERPEDMPLLAALRNDLETQAWSKTLPPDYTHEMLLKRLQAREFSYDRTDGRFIIGTKQGGEFAGSIVYSNVESRHSAMVGWMVARKFWGKGVALDAHETLLRFLFMELGLRVVRLWTHSGNPRAVGMAVKSGFAVSVRQRQAVFKGGEFYDNLLMDILREEYFSIHPDLADALPAL